MQELADPARSLDRARETWQKHGRSQKWIQQRMTGQETRNKLTDYWREHDIKAGEEYAILTNIIHQEWAEVDVKAHKNMKGLQTQNLRDHMSEAELIFTALAELSTRQIAESMDAVGMQENKAAAKKGGGIAYPQGACPWLYSRQVGNNTRQSAQRIGKQNRQKSGKWRKLFTP